MRRLTAIGAIVILLLFSCSKPAIENDKGDFDKGLEALRAGNPTEALNTFHQLESTDAGSPYGAYGVALTYDAEGLLYEAVDAFQKLVAKYKDFTPAYLSLAVMGHRTGLDGLSLSMLDLYRKTASDSGFTVALRIDVLVSLGFYNDAAEAVADGLSKFPDDPLVDMAAAKYYIHSGDPAKSRQLAEQAINSAGNHAGVLRLAGEYYALLGLTDSAAVFFENSLKADKNDFYHKAEIGEALLDIGYDYPAEQLTGELLSVNSKSNRARLLRASIYEKRKKFWNAVECYGDATINYPQSPTAMAHLGLLYYEVYNMGVGESYLNNAINIVEEDTLPVGVLVDIQLNRLKAAERMGGNTQTPMTLRMLLGAFPQDYGVIEEAAGIYLKYAPPDSTKRMLGIFEKAIEGNPVRLAAAGQIYAKADSLNAALRCYQKALSTDKISYLSMSGTAFVYQEQGDIQKALTFLVNQGEPAASYPLIARDKIALFQANKQLGGALREAVRQVDLGPRDIDRYRTALTLTTLTGNKERAQRLIEQCLTANANVASAIALAGEYFLDHDNLTEAQQCLSKIASLDSANVDGLILKARVDTMQGRFDEAITTYRKAISIDQYAGDAINGLACLLIDKKGEYAVAANEVSSAISTDPGNPEYHMTEGRAYYKMGRYNMARGNFETALKLAPDHPLINYYAGINYIKDNKPDKAKICLQKALAGNLSRQLRADAESALQGL